jgi:outer membrane receptor protein involved in Fe transport
MTYRQNLNIPGPAYTLLNASATLSFNDRWDLRLYGRNLGDTRAQVNTQIDSVTPAWVYVNRPRTIGLEMTLHTM